MEIINAIIRKTPVNKNLPFNPYCYRLVLVRANGTREELPGIMSLQTASAAQKLFRKNA